MYGITVNEMAAMSLERTSRELAQRIEAVGKLSKAEIAEVVASQLAGGHAPTRMGMVGVERMPLRTVQIDRAHAEHELRQLDDIVLDMANRLANLKRARKRLNVILDGIEAGYRGAASLAKDRKPGFEKLIAQLDAEIEVYRREADEEEKKRKTLETALEAHERAAKTADENQRLRQQLEALKKQLRDAVA